LPPQHFVLLLNECLFHYRLSPKTFGYTLVYKQMAVDYMKLLS